jgi:TonB family protein
MKNPARPTPSRRVSTLLLVLLAMAAAAPSLGAQQAPARAGWHLVARGEDGTTVSIDSASIARSGDSTFVVHTVIEFSTPVKLDIGVDVTREVDVEELDCAKALWRGRASQLYADTQQVMVAQLDGEWVAVPENRRAVFNASCAYLLGSFAATLPREYDVALVEEAPEVVNRPAVEAALWREYPPMMRTTGQSGEATLYMRVLPDGTVDRKTIEIIANSRREFGEAARRVALTMRFRPARVAKAPVPVWVTLPVTFRLDPSESPVRMMPGTPMRFSPPEIPPSRRRPD